MGRLCKRDESSDARASRSFCYSKEDYMNRVLKTLLTCSSGKSGILKWTPNAGTPNIVYYQVSCGESYFCV